MEPGFLLPCSQGPIIELYLEQDGSSSHPHMYHPIPSMLRSTKWSISFRFTAHNALCIYNPITSADSVLCYKQS